MKTPHTIGSALCAGLVLTLTGIPAPVAAQDGQVYNSARHNFSVTVVADGLQNPWSMAWLPNGDMLITEREGRLRLVRDGALHPEPISGTPEVRAQGQGGLLEVKLHPDFQENRILYLTFSKPNADASEATTALVRARLEGHSLVDVEEIFVAEAWATGNAHFAGRLAFDEDGYLFLSVGDRGANPDLLDEQPAQDLSNHQGTVLRLTEDGEPAPGNPFLDRPGALPEIWSYGHRNPQGMIVHPITGDVWANEHGPRGGDELNVARRGENYGWPVVGYGINYSGSIITEVTMRDDIVPPLYTWVPSIATSGLMVYTGDRFPWWQGSVFVGGLGAQQISRLTFDGFRAVSEEILLQGELGRIRDVRQGPDGYIYVAVDGRGETTPVVRLEPAESDMETPSD